MFVINPDLYSAPSYRIGAFITSSVARNALLYDKWASVAIDYFNHRFGKDNWIMTKNGREAIAIALRTLNLQYDRKVTILTPSNNFYISSCVTETIEMFSQWNRVESSDTGAYFVNHEFGYLYSDMENLVKEGRPVIEDCCTTFFSQNSSGNIGKLGDYAIYSFPKFFGIQIGGLLVGERVKDNTDFRDKIFLSSIEQEYILKVVGYELSQVNELLERRRHIFEYASNLFQDIGFSLRFSHQEGIVPSLLLLNNHGIINDLQAHKEFLYKHGIQNSVFYGEDAFFLPCHQHLTEQDMDYFQFVVKNFILQQV